jgi:hypothetical protein
LKLSPWKFLRPFLPNPKESSSPSPSTSDAQQPSHVNYPRAYANSARRSITPKRIQIGGLWYEYDAFTDVYVRNLPGGGYHTVTAATLANMSAMSAASITHTAGYVSQALATTGTHSQNLGWALAALAQAMNSNGTTPNPEYADRGFYTEPTRGLRTFKVNADNELTGLFYHQAWGPGVNDAVCFKATPYGDWQRDREHWLRQDDHTMDTCKHGFYAFYDGSNSFSYDGQVIAMVEGLGTVLVGSRGFRASKAKIVAMVLNIKPDDDRTFQVLGFSKNSVTQEQADAIRAKYPDVPVFDSVEAMRAEYPCVGMDESDYLDPRHNKEDEE